MTARDLDRRVQIGNRMGHVGANALLVAMIAMFAAVCTLRPTALAGPFLDGAIWLCARPDRALALAGVVLSSASAGISQTTDRRMRFALPALLAAIFAGIVVGTCVTTTRFFDAVEMSPQGGVVFGVLSPLACLVVGLSLALPARLAGTLRLPLLMTSSLLIMSAAAWSDPSSGWRFRAGAASGLFAAAILGGAVVAVFHRLMAAAAGAAAVAVRIGGSWLVAVGLLVASAVLVPKPSEPPTDPLSAAPTTPSSPQPERAITLLPNPAAPSTWNRGKDDGAPMP